MFHPVPATYEYHEYPRHVYVKDGDGAIYAVVVQSEDELAALGDHAKSPADFDQPKPRKRKPATDDAEPGQ